MRVTTSSVDDWRFDSAKRPQKAGPFSARISSSATGRWIITSSLCDPVKLGSMSPPSLQCGRAKRWGELGRIPSLYLAETMDIILFPIISLEGVSTKWLRYVEVCEVEILAPSLYKWEGLGSSPVRHWSYLSLFPVVAVLLRCSNRRAVEHWLHGWCRWLSAWTHMHLRHRMHPDHPARFICHFTASQERSVR